MAISLLALPGEKQYATAQTATYPYIGVLPNPVGVNQEVLLHIGVTTQLNSQEEGWEDLWVTIDRPDGDQDIIDNVRTDSTGGTGRNYVPDIAGNYTFITHFPAQNITDFWGEEIAYAASESDPVVLVVQEEPITFYPSHPLPTEYWSRPIDPALRSWSAVGASWLETPENYIAECNDDAPETAHVLWTKAFTTGGLVGQLIDDQPHSFEIGDAYEGKWSNRIIMSGKLYFNKYANPDAAPSGTYRTIVCMDLHTGEELWERTLLNNLSISYGQLMYWDTYDYHGVYDYIWASGNSETAALIGAPSSPLCAFDPFTGDFQWAFYDMPSGDRVMGPKGEILYYDLDLDNGYMLKWNSSAVISLRSSTTPYSMGFGQWKAPGKIQNATGTCPVTYSTPLGINGYMYNVSIPDDLPGDVLHIFEGDRIVGGEMSQTEVSLWAINLNTEHGDIGDEIFRDTWEAPDYWEEGDLTVSGFGGGFMAYSDDPYVAVAWLKETREHYGFSLDGEGVDGYLWGPTDPQYYLDSVEDSTSDVRNIAYGNLYCASVSGIVYCYNATTGEKQWEYAATATYPSEYLFATTWWMKPVAFADGKVYVGHAEHSPIDPRPRGAPFVCLNATTGEVIFRVDGMFRQSRWGGRGIMGDSIIATQDTYDQRVWAIGKGPSATTVEAGPDSSVFGTSVVVTGMVTDVSPGTNDGVLPMRFPNGVPAVCDANMSEWMLYVYKQYERPADIVGVDVVISVLDPNNNAYEVATTTSDASGYFGCTFEPEVPGFYKIVATFDGSGSYYGSFAETFVNVEEAPQPTPTPTPSPAPMTDTYVLGIGAGAIVAIVVIGLVIILMLRRR
jgi:outer membrane protein assembly factor BamB